MRQLFTSFYCEQCEKRTLEGKGPEQLLGDPTPCTLIDSKLKDFASSPIPFPTKVRTLVVCTGREKKDWKKIVPLSETYNACRIYVDGRCVKNRTGVPQDAPPAPEIENPDGRAFFTVFEDQVPEFIAPSDEAFDVIKEQRRLLKEVQLKTIRQCGIPVSKLKGSS